MGGWEEVGLAESRNVSVPILPRVFGLSTPSQLSLQGDTEIKEGWRFALMLTKIVILIKAI